MTAKIVRSRRLSKIFTQYKRSLSCSLSLSEQLERQVTRWLKNVSIKAVARLLQIPKMIAFIIRGHPSFTKGRKVSARPPYMGMDELD